MPSNAFGAKSAQDGTIWLRPRGARDARTQENGGVRADSAIPCSSTTPYGPRLRAPGHPHSNCIGASIRWTRSRAWH